MGVRDSQENLLPGGDMPSRRPPTPPSVPADQGLSQIEKRFLLSAERGDCATVKRLLEQHRDSPDILDINCVDPLNRSALISAIENENIELVRMLLDMGIRVNDSLLHAIKEQYVEAVELLLEWEETTHAPGQPYSWEAVDRGSSAFTPDITPLVLAAHMNNYEILKILLDRGATLPMPHDVKCGCDECVTSSETDSLRHSQARINAYRALSSPSLIALSSRDPLQTAFELGWELRRLSRIENEFRDEYNEMRTQVQTFATALVDHVRTSMELEVMLNHDKESVWLPGERHTLGRLKMAIKYKQKRFVAHPNVQQLLAAIWYDGLPGFRRKSPLAQLMGVARLGAMFPIYSTIYMLAPSSSTAQFLKKPFVKFICHSASYAFFLLLLSLASQRAEFLLIEWFGTDWMQELLQEWKDHERGALPGPIELAVMLYVISLIWHEVRSLWSDGLLEYVGDLWNIVDFITNVFYMIWICLRFTSWFIVQREYWNGTNPWYPREEWDQFDPMLLSEGAFAAGMIFSYLKLVHIFSVNPHLGPLQISLGRMIIDILKFFFIYSLVLFAFGCGMNQLLRYYAELEKQQCYHQEDGSPDFEDRDKACTIWRRFTNMFETSQSLFWASFGLIDLMNFELTGIKSFTRFWAMLMFGSYSVINIIVLLNMLIAMMSTSYQIISERADIEWKFARSRLWMSYFEEGDTVPAPFNVIPTPKSFVSALGCRDKTRNTTSFKDKSRQNAVERYDGVMRLLVRRYVTAEQCKRDDYGVTEDDVMEIRQDISTLRFELLDVLRNNGMRTPNVGPDSSVAGKKGRVMERRLLKDFQIGRVEGLITQALTSDRGPRDVFSKIARAIGRRSSTQASKKDWNALVRGKSMVRDPIGSTSVRQTRQSLRRHILDSQNEPLASMDPAKLLEYNPKLAQVTPATRIAYAKFKMPKIKQEYQERADGAESQQGDPVTDDSVIARPRPRASCRRPSEEGSVRRPSVHRQQPEQPPTPDPEQDQKGQGTKLDLPPNGTACPKDFRSTTPIPEDSSEEEGDSGTTADTKQETDQKKEEKQDPKRSTKSPPKSSADRKPGNWL